MDGDGGATTARASRTALTELFSAGAERARRLVVDRAAPAFDEAEGEAKFNRLLDDQAAGPRWGGPGCGSAKLREGFGVLNGEQQRAVERAFAADDYALIRGMPGAGKTATAAFLIRALVASGARVLVASGGRRAGNPYCSSPRLRRGSSEWL